MVIESVCVSWDSISVHYPPELPLSLRDSMRLISPGWELFHQTDDETVVKNGQIKASIASSNRGTKAVCFSTYGHNLVSLGSIAETIKRLGIFSKRMLIKRDMEREICEARVVCRAYPKKIIPQKNISYYIREGVGNDYRDFKKISESLKRDAPVAYVDREEDSAEIRCFTNFYDFKTKYKHVFSRTFVF